MSAMWYYIHDRLDINCERLYYNFADELSLPLGNSILFCILNLKNSCQN